MLIIKANKGKGKGKDKDKGDIEQGLSLTDNISSTVTDSTDKNDDNKAKNPDSILNNKDTQRSSR